MATVDKGKWAEKQAQDWLDRSSNSSTRFAYHRFPDARAARGALSKQPSDYLVSTIDSEGHRRSVMLEVKETANPRRLPKDKIGQYGKLRMFWLAGTEIVVLVYRSALNDWVFLGPNELFQFEECPASFVTQGLVSYPSASVALASLFPTVHAKEPA